MATDLPLSRNRFLRFLVAGLPAFALAVPLNGMLVGLFAWPKPAAYAFVLLLQVVANFILCRRYVFTEGRGGPWLRQFVAFMVSILAFRTLDWCAYSWLTRYWPDFYLLIQIVNVAIFALLKFTVSQLIFARKPPVVQRHP